MSHNPYAPPAAPVSDPRLDVPAVRPTLVIWGVRLQWIAFGISSVVAFASFSSSTADIALVAKLVKHGLVWLVGFLLTLWLLTAAWRGRGWSRFVWAGLILLGLFSSWYVRRYMPEATASPWYTQLLSLGTTMIEVIGTFLLFTPAANSWYRAMRDFRRR